MKKITFLPLLTLIAGLGNFASANADLLNVTQLPLVPVLEQSSRLFVHWETNLGSTGSDEISPLISAKLDGQNISVEHPYGSTWLISLPQFSQIGEHSIGFDLSLENTAVANSLRVTIEVLEQDISLLNDAIANEQDPDIRADLIAQRTQKTNDKNAAQAQLPATITKIRHENYQFSVASNLDVDALFHNIRLEQNHQVLIQNDDAGWDFYDSPDAMRNHSDASGLSQFGLHALSLLGAYSVTLDGAVLGVMDKTATKLFNDPVGVKVGDPAARCTRSYSADQIFLSQASSVLFPEYFAKGQENFLTEKDCLAAMAFLNTIDQNDPSIDSVSQQELDSVSDAQRVATFDARLASFGRDEGTRAFDWYGRMMAALQFGDSAYAQAIAEQVATNSSAININSDSYLLGLAQTISTLLPFVAEQPSFQIIIDDFTAKLLAQQKSNGRFQVEASEGAESGNVQDQGFALQALLDLGLMAKAEKLVDYALEQQLANGVYRWYWELGDEAEFVEGNSELLGAMINAYKVFGSKINFVNHKRRNYVELLKNERTYPESIVHPVQ